MPDAFSFLAAHACPGVYPGVFRRRKIAPSRSRNILGEARSGREIRQGSFLFSREIADSFGLRSRPVLIVTARGNLQRARFHASLTIRDMRGADRHFRACHLFSNQARIENDDSSRLCSPDTPKVNASPSPKSEPVKEALPIPIRERRLAGRKAKKNGRAEPGQTIPAF